MQKVMKICQNHENVNFNNSKSDSKLSHVGSKSRSLGQIMKKKPCVHSRGHSFDQQFMKRCQNVKSLKI